MSDIKPPAGREHVLEATLRACGRRPMPSADGTARAYAQAQGAWHRMLAVNAAQRRRRGLRWAVGLIAASVACAAIVVGSARRSVAPDMAGSVARVQGIVYGSGASSTPIVLHAGDPVAVGYRLETAADGRLALRLPRGRSLRLDHETRLTVTAANEYRLESGRIYFDSGVSPGGPALHIATPLGVLTDYGTQFQAAWLQNRLQVRVREGSVGVAAKAPMPRQSTVVAGELASLGPDGELVRARSESYGPAWAWITDLTTGPGADEQRLEPILEWICRELGCRLRYGGNLTREMVGAVTLDGSIEGLTPQQALEVVGRVTTFRYRLESGELTVERADAPH
jgi:ferric-dicitrate binding protein FerR (iron transport regulator)